MQLPRGAFRDIKKEISLESLLAELKEASFSGYCKIASEKISATIVLRKGVIILAHSGEERGDAALAAIVIRRGEDVDAVLHDLNDTQVDLTLEFNPSDRVQEPLKAISPRKIGREDRKAAPAVRSTGFSLPHPGRSQPVTDPEAHQTLSPILQEFITLEGMDFETMSRTFRENCRQIIEKLDLEFLLESEKQKGGP